MWWQGKELSCCLGGQQHRALKEIQPVGLSYAFLSEGVLVKETLLHDLDGFLPCSLVFYVLSAVYFFLQLIHPNKVFQAM